VLVHFIKQILGNCYGPGGFFRLKVGPTSQQARIRNRSQTCHLALSPLIEPERVPELPIRDCIRIAQRRCTVIRKPGSTWPKHSRNGPWKHVCCFEMMYLYVGTGSRKRNGMVNIIIIITTVMFCLRVEFLLKTESGYLRDAEVT